MKQHSSRNRWIALIAWTAGAAALGSIALPSAVMPAATILVALFATLMLLVQLRWQAAVRRAGRDREQTLALLRETLESTPDGLLLLDLEGKVVSFNRQLTALSGLAPEALAHGSFAMLLAWVLEQSDDSAGFLSHVRTLEAHPHSEARDEIRLRDGRIFEWYSRCHRVGSRVAGRLWGVRDVTSERTALEALHRREQQLAQAQQIAHLGSYDWDVRANQVTASAELWRIAGYEPEAFPWTFERYVECIHADDRPLALAQVEAALSRGEPLACEVRVVHPDGTVLHVAAAGHVTRDADGAPVRLVGTAQDVTQRRNAAANLERRVRVEQSLTNISQLFASSSAVDTAAVLRLLGEALGARRTYLLQSRCDGGNLTIERAEEWCAVGVAPALGALAGHTTSVVTWRMQQLRDHGRLLICSVAAMPEEAADDRAQLERQGVASAAAVPIRGLRQGLNGLLGLDFGAGGPVASDEDIRALRTTGEMLVAQFARERAEREIAQRDAILEAVSFMAERFLLTSEWYRDLDDALGRIGSAAGASRAYLFENRLDADGNVRVSQRAEWVAVGIDGRLASHAMQDVRLAELGLGGWEEQLRRNEPVQQLVGSLPPEGREHLESRGIRSVLLIPIFVDSSWWGSLGFDDCVLEREWSHAEREVLMAAGRMIGAGIHRRRAVEALRESELRFKQLSENIPEVFFMAPVDMSELLYLSPSFEKVWGRTMAEAYGNPLVLIESILPEDLPVLYADPEPARSRRGDAMRHIDYRIHRPDGSIRWIRNRVFQIPDANGQPYRVAGVCTDITDHKQLEDDLKRANRIEAIGHLAAGIAHEINTPIQYVGDNLRFLDESHAGMMAALQAYQALLEEARLGAISPERLAEFTAAVERTDVEYLMREAPRASAQALDGVQRVAEIVRAMKEFSHPGTGLKVPTDLNQSIRSTTTVARNEWKYVAELVTELDEGLPLVHCFPGELSQAILNLVINAAHAITERQQAEGSGDPGTITVSTAMTGSCVEIRVRDTGTGIPVEIRPRIFDPFFTTKEVGRGTGQGLTFVHTIVVEKHGGSVTFETEVGVGTTFIVRLPVIPMAADLGAAA